MRKFLIIFSLFIGLIVLSGALQAQDVRYLTVGRLEQSMDNNGANWMSGNLSRGQEGPSIWYNWQPWPDYTNDIGYHGVDINAAGEHDGHGKAIYGNCSYWFASTNWQAPAVGNWGTITEDSYEAGRLYDIFLNDNGPVTLSAQINSPYWLEPKHIRRVAMPEVIVNGIVQDPVAFNPDGNSFTVDETIKVDGMLHSRWADPMGVTIDEKRYGFTHPLYEAIIISELTIINSGDCNTVGDFADIIEKPGQSLTDFWFGVKHLLADASDWTDFGSFEQYNGEVDWLLDYNTGTRYFWTWDGDAADIPGDDQFDPRGGPGGTADNPTGEFTAPEVIGYAFLYISDGPENTGTAANDPAQPATFRYMTYKDMYSPVFRPEDRISAWNWMTGNDANPTYQAGHSADPYQEVPANQPHYDPVFGVGPYDLAANDSIKVVLAFAVGSIPEVRAIQLGDSVRIGEIDLAAAQQEIYESSRDSLFVLYARAQDLYDNYISQDIDVPYVPAPPAKLEITPGPEQVSLDWDAVTGADGYRVYRATGGIDNGRVYEMIKETTTETAYVDPGRTRGASYYYYVTTVDGGLESSHFFTRTHKEALPTRAPLTTDGWDKEVRVVPNPINVKGNTYIEGATGVTGFNFDGGTREQNTLLFVNLPPKCNIYIYNSVGDLIKTMEHKDGTGDERWSPIITDDNLVPASGVYFYLIEVTEGDMTPKIGKGKFVVVR